MQIGRYMYTYRRVELSNSIKSACQCNCHNGQTGNNVLPSRASAEKHPKVPTQTLASERRHMLAYIQPKVLIRDSGGQRMLMGQWKRIRCSCYAGIGLGDSVPCITGTVRFA